MLGQSDKQDSGDEIVEKHSNNKLASFAISTGIFVRSEDLIKISLVNQFICDFIIIFKSIWVFSLVAIYGIPLWIDTFMWVFPFFLSERIKPLLRIYTKKIKQTRIYKILKVIIVSYILLILGLYMILLSMSPQQIIDLQDITISYKQLRVILFSIGWVLSKSVIEIISNLNQEIQSVIINNPAITWDYEEINNVKVVAKTVACIFSALSVLKIQSYRSLYSSLSNLFHLCSLLCFTAIILLYNFNNFRTVPPKTPVKKQTQGNSKKSYMLNKVINKVILQNRFLKIVSDIKLITSQLQLSKMFDYSTRGYLLVLRVSFEQKMFLMIYLIRKVLVLSVKLYGTVWIAEACDKILDLNQFKYGVVIGAILISSFEIVNTKITRFITLNRKFSALNNEHKTMYETIFIFVSVVLAALYLFCWMYNSLLLVITTLMLTSVLVSNLQVFLDFDQQASNKLQYEYQQSQNTIYCFSRYLVYFWFPLFFNYWTKTKRRTDSFLIISVLMGLLVLVKIYYLKSFKNRGNKDSEIANNMTLSSNSTMNLSISQNIGFAMLNSKNFMENLKTSSSQTNQQEYNFNQH